MYKALEGLHAHGGKAPDPPSDITEGAEAADIQFQRRRAENIDECADVAQRTIESKRRQVGPATPPGLSPGGLG